MVPAPFQVAHALESSWGSGLLSDYIEHFSHSVGDFRCFLIKYESVLSLFLSEGDGGDRRDIVSVQRESDRVVDGDDLTLIEFSPVLNQGDIRRWFEHHWKISSIHHLPSNESILYQQSDLLISIEA